MSAQGHTSSEILAQYFPGTEIADEPTGQPWQILHIPGLTLETLNASDNTTSLNSTRPLPKPKPSPDYSPLR